MKPRRKTHETHLVEWKASWRDGYLKWLCGFANADSGTLIVGMNDRDESVGADNADRLLVLGRVVPVRADQEGPESRRERRGGLTDAHHLHRRIPQACRAYGVAAPIFSEDSGAVTVTFAAEVVVGARDSVPDRHQVGTKLGPSWNQVQVLEIARELNTLPELMGPFGRSNRTKFRDQVLAPLLEAGLVVMTIPEKPRSPKQRYQTTEAGRSATQLAKERTRR